MGELARLHRMPAPTADLAITVSIATWRFVVHRAWCTHYRKAQYRDGVVSPGMRLHVCGHCRPTEEEMEAFLPTVQIYLYAHGGVYRAAPPPDPYARVIPPVAIRGAH